MVASQSRAGGRRVGPPALDNGSAAMDPDHTWRGVERRTEALGRLASMVSNFPAGFDTLS